MNNVLFISSETLNTCQSDHELAVLIAHEISHLLLDHKPLELKQQIANHFRDKYILKQKIKSREDLVRSLVSFYTEN